VTLATLCYGRKVRKAWDRCLKEGFTDWEWGWTLEESPLFGKVGRAAAERGALLAAAC
jgi:hypothetical protein